MGSPGAIGVLVGQKPVEPTKARISSSSLEVDEGYVGAGRLLCCWYNSKSAICTQTPSAHMVHVNCRAGISRKRSWYQVSRRVDTFNWDLCRFRSLFRERHLYNVPGFSWDHFPVEILLGRSSKNYGEHEVAAHGAICPEIGLSLRVVDLPAICVPCI